MKKINLLIVRVLLIFMLPLGAWEFPCSGAAETGHSGQPSGANTQYLSLTPQTKILLGKNAPVPVKTAVNHLQRDIARVLGDSLEVLASMPAGQEKPLIVISFPGAGIRSGNAISGWEAHQVIVDMHKGGQHVFLEGADTRGTVYAIYSFAEKFLDVPPLWFWALYEPERATAIRVPETTRIRFSSPSVKYRTFFPNDDQLLEALLEREPAHRDRVFETMMRLKLNCYETGSLEKYPEGGKNNESLLNARIANKHGMVITTHHVYPVGASLGDWEAYWQFKGHTRAPALDVTNLDPLESFYRDHIRGILEEGFDMLWTVGFRGVGDRPWFTAFDHVEASDSLFGAVIEKMIHTQIHLLEEEAGTGVMMRSQFYNEGADLFAGGHIHLPVEKENLIWSFDDVSSSRVPQPYMLEYTYAPHQKLGYYFHFQHSRTGSHFVQGVGPWKMEQNYRMVNALTQAPLAFSVVNSGNIREFVMEISSNAAMMWDLEDYDSGRFLWNF